MPKLTAAQILHLRPVSLLDQVKLEYKTTINYLQSYNVRIPLTTFPDEIGDHELSFLLKRFGSDIMTLYNAVLLCKRVVFIGEDISTEKLSSSVLAACCLVTPPMSGVATLRAFPYCEVSYPKVPGFVAGVLQDLDPGNFAWDIMCDLKTGKITVHPDVHDFDLSKFSSVDNEFYQKINFYMIGDYGEAKIRSLFMAYTQQILDVAITEREEFPKEYDKQEARILTLRTTSAFHDYHKEWKKKAYNIFPNDSQIPIYAMRLRYRNDLTEAELLKIFQKFKDNIKVAEAIDELLAFFPSSFGGLTPLAMPLFNPSQAVVKSVVILLSSFNDLKLRAGDVNFVSQLNPFLLLRYERLYKTFMI